MLDSLLESCIYDYDVVHCNDIHGNNDVHRAQINEMCNTIITNCLSASAESIPRTRPHCKTLPRWNEEVNYSHDASQFWLWIWLEDRKPMAHSTSVPLCGMARKEEKN